MLKSGSHKALVDDGIGVALYEHEMPPRGQWPNWDFVSATKVLVEIFLAGDDQIPILSELLNKVSARIKSTVIVSFFQKVLKPNEASENSEPKKIRAKKNQNSKKVQAKQTGPPKKKPLKKKKSPKKNATRKYILFGV